MHPHIAALVFALLFVAPLGLALISGLYEYINSLARHAVPEPLYPQLFLIPAGMCLFVYVLVMFGFWTEAVGSSRFFRDLFEAK
jgi:hypothetical protein